jgi:tetratricopeptide (TPR) repeat protein
MGFFDKFRKDRGKDKTGEIAFDQTPADEDTLRAGRAEERDLSIPHSGFDDSLQKKSQSKPTSVVQPLREEGAVYFRRGNAYFKLENYERAIQDYTRAIVVFPEYIEAYFNRAMAYKNIRNYHRAIEDYSRIIEIAPNFVAAYAARAALYADLNDHDSALEDMKAAARLGSKDIQELLKTKGIEW